MPPWLLLLLPLAAISGWWAARRAQLRLTDANASLPRDYFVGLNYLLNEQPDKALDIFIKMIDVDSDTVETHLALGNLFRRRGEVERAIRIHQNLIARPHLGKQYRIQALLELGQDYLRAGVFDRAEKLFLEVVEMGEQTTPSLQYLLDIYQQEKDWEQAIKIAQQLERSSNQDMQPVIAHYYCEIAERAWQHKNIEQVERYIKRALAVDRNCVRASLLEAESEMVATRYKSAIRACKRIKTQDPDFLIEAIPLLMTSYERLHDEVGAVNYLRQCLEEHPRISIVLIFAEQLQRTQSSRVAADFLAEQLRRRPSIRGLANLIELHLMNVDSSARDSLTVLRNLMEQLLQGKPNYQCRHCGYTAKMLSWQCPSCKEWNAVKPIHGLEGD